MVIEEEIYKIYQLEKLGEDKEHDWNWLPENANRAFLICLGAGPWKVNRRVTVQREAVEWFEQKWKDISAIPKYGKLPFPLEWQNRYLREMIMSLVEQKATFEQKCIKWTFFRKKWEANLVEFFRMCGVGPEGKKCLWLFARDFLHLPAFPIDRHVERSLKEVGLPGNDPWHIMELCHIAGKDPSALNRALFLAKAENHDWSESERKPN